MAKQAKEEAAQASKSISKTELQKFMREAVARKQEASEAASEAGSYIKNQIERHGLDRTAITIAMKLKGMEIARQQAVVRALLDYLYNSGVFDQVDLFDDTVKIMEAIVASIKGNPRRPDIDEAVSSMAN